MNPLLTFSAGIFAGILAIRWVKGEKTRRGVAAAEQFVRESAAKGREKAKSGFETAQEGLRGAAIASLESVERSSARLRTQLTPAGEVVSAEKPKPARAPRKKTAPRGASRKRAEA